MFPAINIIIYISLNLTKHVSHTKLRLRYTSSAIINAIVIKVICLVYEERTWSVSEFNVFSSQCFCGDNEVSERYKSSEADCHMKCTGDRTTICGGVWRNTLYRTGNKGKVQSPLFSRLKCLCQNMLCKPVGLNVGASQVSSPRSN